MKLCPDCQKREPPTPRHLYCTYCGGIREIARTTRSNQKASEKRAAKDGKCRCGCGRTAIHPHRYAPECKDARAEVMKEEARERAKTRYLAIKEGTVRVQQRECKEDTGEGYEQIEMIKPWVPRPKPKPIMTRAQQLAIDADTYSRMMNNKVWPVSTHWLMQ